MHFCIVLGKEATREAQHYRRVRLEQWERQGMMAPDAPQGGDNDSAIDATS